jgi:signal peptidase II
MSFLQSFTRARALALIVAIIVIDQITKLYFHTQYTPGQRTNLLPFFDWILTYNTGAAFSFLASAGGWQRWFFIVLGFAVTAWCWRWIGKESDGRIRLALTFVIAGAIGNVIDRIWLGKVIDFILIYWAPWNWDYPAFNVADSAICIGAALMIGSSVFVRKETAQQ